MARPGSLGRVAAVAAGTALAAVVLRFRRRPNPAGDKRDALVAYLREHLSGADATIQVVRRLASTSEGQSDRQLFRDLLREFEQDHETVCCLLRRLRVTARSAKRAAGSASGRLVRLAAGGEPGDLSLLRTLEGLAIGIQGKRCLWRALQELAREVSRGGETFVALEARAVRQWERVDRRRRALAAMTFPKLGSDAPSHVA